MLEQQPIPDRTTPPAPPAPPSPSSGEPGLELAKLLSRARSRQRTILAASAALSTLAGMILIFPGILGLAATGSALARPLTAIAALAGLGAFLWFGAARARRQIGDEAATARLLARRLSPSPLGAGLLPAWELTRALAAQGPVDFSRTLAEAHIRATEEAARAISLGAVLPDRPVRLAARALLVCAALSAFAGIAFRDAMSRGATRLFAAAEPTARKPARPAEPITGEIELAYAYPAYTRLPPRTVPNTNGEISAPRGTQVRLKTRADREVAQASVVVGSATFPLEVENGRGLAGTLNVDAPGSYRFRFLDKRGRVLAEGPPLPIAVEEDARPKAALVAPMGDTEVDPKGRVSLRFEAEDDYGVSEIALLFKLPGAPNPERVVLQRPADAPRRAASTWEWDVGPLGLMAGDTVAYYVEATDNDEISGKKTGASKTQFLHVFSEAERHRKTLRRIEASWEKLVTLLADRLESPERAAEGRTAEKILSQSAVDTRALELAREIADLAVTLKKDKAPEQLWRALTLVSSGLLEKASATADARNALSVWLQRGSSGLDSEAGRRLSRALEREIAEEEKDVLYLETLVDQQRIEDLIALSKELAAKRRDLADLLERYRTAPDDATRERLVREIARLKERMAELMQRMAELSKGINDEHMNPEALKELSHAEDLMSSFDKLQEMLAKGKVEDAMKEMEKLGQALDSLEQRLQRASKEFKGGEFGELGKSLRQFAQDLDGLEAEQQKVLDETQKLRGNYKKQLEDRLKQKGSSFVEKLRKKAEAAQEKLEGVSITSGGLFRDDELKRAKDEAANLHKALSLKDPDFDQAGQSVAKALNHAQQLAEEFERAIDDAKRLPPSYREHAAQAQKNLRSTRAALPPLQEIKKELESLLPPPGAAMSEADKQQMKELQQKEAQLQNRAGELRQKMDELNKQAPLFPPQAQGMLQQAGDRMGRAQGQMQKRNPTGAVAEQRAALDQLGELKKGLQQQQQQSGGAGGSPVPWPWMSPGSGMESGENGTEAPRDEEVKIPDADQFKAPEEYRKDIMDAMKQGAPEKYKDQVKRYYEEIVK